MRSETASTKSGSNALDYDRGTFFLLSTRPEAISLLAGHYALGFS